MGSGGLPAETGAAGGTGVLGGVSGDGLGLASLVGWPALGGASIAGGRGSPGGLVTGGGLAGSVAGGAIAVDDGSGGLSQSRIYGREMIPTTARTTATTVARNHVVEKMLGDSSLP